MSLKISPFGSIVRGNRVDLKRLESIARKPPPFHDADASFWDDPYVSNHVLNAHLDPLDDEASRRPEIIDASVEWMAAQIRQCAPLDRPLRIIDLGCGPGLYAQRFAAQGFQVTGVDLSAKSIAYARKAARRDGLSIEYRVADYLNEPLEGPYDAALLIYGGLSELDPAQCEKLLRRTHAILRDGGMFIADVVTPRYAQRVGETDGWYVTGSDGFWERGYHLVLEQSFHYPEESAHLQRFIVILPDGTVKTMPLWRRYFSPTTLNALFSRFGFEAKGWYGDLAGKQFEPTSEWLGSVATKAPAT